MKLLLCSLLLSLFPVTAFSQLEIYPLTDNFYVYTTYHDYKGELFPSNSLYVITEAGAVMIDTPWDTAQVQPLLDSIKARHNKDVIMCIATHFHADRTGGFDVLKRLGIKTYSTDQTLKLCKTHGEKEAEYTFTGDTIFNAGGVEFEVFYPGAGHAPDNIVVWFPKAKVLHGGCFVKSTESDVLGNMSDADPKSWQKSVLKTMEKFPDAEYIITGHQDWRDAKGLEHTLKLLRNYNANKKYF
jgi:metallo-beta-lactamase class B